MANVGDIKPHSGGIKIPQAVKDRTRNRILAYTEKHYSGDYSRIDVRFRGQFCYIDAYTEPHDHPDFEASLFSESREEYIERLRNRPLHLCRLRYFGDEDRWSYTHTVMRSMSPAFSIMSVFLVHPRRHLKFLQYTCDYPL